MTEHEQIVVSGALEQEVRGGSTFLNGGRDVGAQLAGHRRGLPQRAFRVVGAEVGHLVDSFAGSPGDGHQ